MPANGTRAPAAAPETELRDKARGMTDLALETLEKLMKARKAQASVKLGAAREVLDRGYGKPKAGDAEAGAEGLTVVVQRFTDAPDPEAGEYEERL